MSGALLAQLTALALAAALGVQLVLGLVLLPLAAHARGMLAEAFFRELLPRVQLLSLCSAGLAAAFLLWRDGRVHLLLSCMVFVAMGAALARHTLRLRAILGRAHAEPAAVVRPLQFLNTAQLAVTTAAIIANAP